MLNIWIFLCRVATYAYFASRFQVGWSRLYRWLYERQYKDVKIASYDTLQDIARVMRRQSWVMDSWKELFNAVSSPQKVQALINANERGARIGDCDEFAIYIVSAVRRSMMQLRMPGVLSAQLLTVMWNSGWVPNGHNVCLLQMLDNYRIRYAYMDYGLPSKMYDTVEEVAKAVREAYDKNAIPLMYAVSTEDLTMIDIKWAA